MAILVIGLARKVAFVAGGREAQREVRVIARALVSKPLREWLAEALLLRRLRHAPLRRWTHVTVVACFMWLLLVGSLGGLLFRALGVDGYRDVPWFALSNDLAGLLLTAALVAAVARRRLDAAGGPAGRRFAASLLVIVLSGFVVEALRIASAPPSDRAASFVATLLARPLAAVATDGWHAAAWWAHALLSLAFVAYLPFTRGLHLFLAPATVALDSRAGVGDEHVALGQQPGIGSRERLALEACLRCGDCLAPCEVAAAKEGTMADVERFVPLGKIARCHEMLRRERGDASLLADLSEGVFDCTLCARCAKACPIGIDTRGVMLAMREELVTRRAHPDEVDAVGATIAETHNVVGAANEDRALWLEMSETLSPDCCDKDSAEVLYFVGCMSSFSPAVQEIPQALLALMTAAGEDVAVLGEHERCCGFPLVAAGLRRQAARLVAHNLAQVKRLGVRRIVFNCPSCLHAWRHYYRPEGVELLHETEYLAQLLRQGRLQLEPSSDMLTYHDPCDLGRGCGVYEAPRELLAHWPAFRELPQSGEDGYCCGGGGDLELTNPQLAREVSTGLAAEIANTGATTVATACPQCKRMLLGALSSCGDVRVRDVAELVLAHGAIVSDKTS